MLKNNTCGIIGLGLIGGSLGLGLKKAGIFNQILGFDNSSLHAQQALSLGLVDEIVSFEEILRSDVILLAMPVGAILESLPKFIGISQNTTIFEFGSTKSAILEKIPEQIREQFVSAHTMAGTEFSGPKAAKDGLFKDKIVVLIDLEKTAPNHALRARELFLALEMNIVKMDANSHDAHAAFISHSPHILSFALANSVLAQENPRDILSLAGGGFAGMVRLAKSSPIMWRDISEQNKTRILEALAAFSKELQTAQKLIENDDFSSLQEWFCNANKIYEIL